MFLFYSTLEAKTDFMRIIRQTIRDSVRKMALPSNGQNSLKNKYIPCSGKRLEALSSNPRSTLSKKRQNSSNSKADVERHSMELEEKFRLEEDSVFRMRSKTVGDLNEVSSEDYVEESDENFSPSHQPSIPHCGGLTTGASSENSSCSNLSVSSHSGSSAKLTFASANPLKFSSAAARTPPMGSPIWKPRNEANVAKQQQFLNSNIGVTEPNLTLKDTSSHGGGLKDTEC